VEQRMNVNETQEMIRIREQRLYFLKQQQASYGPLTPPHITIEIEQLEAEQQYQRTQLIFQARDLNLQPPPPCQGLILLVSPLRANEPLHALSAYQAINYHRPPLRRCWLIATTGATGSESTAEALAQHFRHYRLDCTVHTIANGADAAETLTLVAALYAQIAQAATFAQADVIADITGGTKPMTAGMVLACGPTRPMQYMLFQQSPDPSLPVLLHVEPAQEPA
jgi:hypothetical protein